MAKALLSQLLDPDFLDTALTSCRLVTEMLVHLGVNVKLSSDSDRPQLQAYMNTTMHTLVLGGNQSGKSFVAAKTLYDVATHRHPTRSVPDEATIWVVSATFLSLQNGVWRNFLKICPPWEIEEMGPCQYRTKVRSYVKMRSGVTIYWYSAQGGKSGRRRLQADSVNAIFVDEEIDDVSSKELDKRRIACGGWVFYSVTAVESSSTILDLEELAERGHRNVRKFRLSSLQAVHDGHASSDDVDDIISRGTQDEIDVRIYGETLKNRGLVYSEWGYDHVCEDFDIPKEWPRYCALDPGFSNFAIIWGTVSPTGRVYLYRELLLKRIKSLRTVYESIRMAEGWHCREGMGWFADDASEQMTLRLVDPAEYGMNPNGTPKVANLLNMEPPMGFDPPLNVIPADNEVGKGIQLVKRLLEPMADGLPGLQCFRSLVEFQRERARYRYRPSESGTMWGDDRPNRPVKRDDHLMDAWRYLTVATFGCDSSVSPESFYGLRPPSSESDKEEIRRLAMLGVFQGATDEPAHAEDHGAIW